MQSWLSVVAIVIVGSLLALSTSWAQGSGHRMITSSDLKWEDVPSLPPGAKIAVIEGPMSEAVPFTIRLKFPAHYSIPAHWHPAVERVTVLSGTSTLHPDGQAKIDSFSALCLSVSRQHHTHFLQMFL